MSEFDVRLFKNLKENFINVTKRVLKKNITTNQTKLTEYRSDVPLAYNEVVEYIAKHWNKLHEDDKVVLKKDINYLRCKLMQCCGKLNGTVELDANLLRSVDKIEIVQQEEEVDDDSEEEPERNNRDEMAPTQIEMMRLYAQTINKNYAGDPLGLQSFLNSVTLLKSMTEDAHLTILKQFILSKLEGKALESVPQNPGSIDEIINALKARIKPEGSKVVTGKLMALKTDRLNASDFSKQAEGLAEALQRALVMEKIDADKAREMTVDKMVELCRGNARTDLVKSILGAGTFSDPKDVIAKFVVESATEAKEKNVLAFRSNYNRNGRNRNFGNNRMRGKGNYGNGYYNNRYGGANNNNGNGNYRGNYRSGQGGYGQRGRYNDRGGRNSFGNNNSRNVRYTENSDLPSGDRRGSNQQQNRDPTNRAYGTYSA